MKKTETVKAGFECVDPSTRKMCGAFANGHYEITKIGPVVMGTKGPIIDEIYFTETNKESVEKCSGHYWDMMGL